MRHHVDTWLPKSWTITSLMEAGKKSEPSSSRTSSCPAHEEWCGSSFFLFISFSVTSINMSPVVFVAFLLLSSLFSCDAFYSPFSRSVAPPSPVHEGSTNNEERIPSLVKSLVKSFPSDTQDHPAYSSVLVLLESLESEPSCQRAATSKFVTGCGTVNPQLSGTADIRIQYAAQLAVCEFESTGVHYPPECRGLLNSAGSRSTRCVKRLEERPQWWTTLSNNIQNALLICAAVRHETEKGTKDAVAFIESPLTPG